MCNMYTNYAKGIVQLVREFRRRVFELSVVEQLELFRVKVIHGVRAFQCSSHRDLTVCGFSILLSLTVLLIKALTHAEAL